MPRSIATLIAAVLAAAAAALAASPAMACDASRHARAVHAGHGGRAPLIIGDSVLLGAVPQVARAGYEVDAKGCRRIDQGLAILRQRRNSLPGFVVLALGTNASVTTSDIRRALTIVGPDRVLGLVTPRETGGGSGADAAAVRAAGRRWPSRVRVVDWVAYSAGHSSWFAGDGIHLGAGGASGMARLLRRVRDVHVELTWSARPAAAPRR
ncbi:SGNH/GDSL hydrolase family protein [Capillimicrobium parvum]|uniref:Acyltransferase n=1 Tax=Capillimicrobium parvum TaxID=2884022 RepID=A0A9E7C0Y9_9ACTN|nr:hypothetical protein [Capillimicrobium parvum]UGS36886.1 hypothetical protein DSM104329_03297 [Capillimicrobium parvum]